MKEKFREPNLSSKKLEQLQIVNNILEDYKSQGYVLTLRQCYYQLVSKGIIPNDDKEYKKLGDLLTEGRMCGLIDWSMIEDRVRHPQIPYWVTGTKDAIRDTINQYRIDLQKGQENYIEVWIEKDALSSVFYNVTEKYHINLMVNRGYSSISAMYKAARRFKSKLSQNMNPIILYFGDHDPSGLDMIRDVRERLSEMQIKVEVTPIALNMQQIEDFNPPPNPAKITDPRAKWYIETYGDISYELDALPPYELENLVGTAIEVRIDIDKYNERIEQQNKDMELLASYLK
jgi:hypothetical protein